MLTIKKLLLISLLFLLSSYQSSAAEFKFISVKGDRVDLTPPAEWKLSWMQGTPDGEYLVEYIPQGDDISSWQHGYLMVERLPYPAGARESIKQAGATISAVALRQTTNMSSKWCQGNFVPTVQALNTFHRLQFAIGGGYCKLPNKMSRFGEGAFVAFIEGQDYLYKIQYGWRPQSKEEQDASPWGIDEATAKKYLESIKSAVICNDEHSDCTNHYQ